MFHSLKIYLTIIPLFFIIDYLWLAVAMNRFYLDELGVLARAQNHSFAPVTWAALLVYILIPLGVVMFALPLTRGSDPDFHPLVAGLLYGIILYGVYDMTNYSLINNWPLRLSIIDILWGGTINAVITFVARLLDLYYT